MRHRDDVAPVVTQELAVHDIAGQQIGIGDR